MFRHLTAIHIEYNDIWILSQEDWQKLNNSSSQTQDVYHKHQFGQRMVWLQKNHFQEFTYTETPYGFYLIQKSI